MRGQHHEVFTRIAEGLGLALPALPPPPDPAPDQVPGGDAANEVGDMNPPAGIRAATDEYMAGQDVHGRWIDECLDLSNPNATLPFADLFASWTAWTEREKKFTGTANAFSRALVRRWGAARKGRGEAGMIFFKGVKFSDS